jgi:general secretion pathway protein J
MSAPRPARARGFTLLELVVVLGIFAVLSVMAYGGLASVLASRERVAASLERTAALQRAYLRLRNDFQQLRARSARDGFGQTQPALLTQRDGAVEFTRSGWRNPLSQPRSTLERVAYRLEDRRLLRESWRAVDRAQDAEPAQAVLLERVTEARWRFLDRGLEWRQDWPQASLAGTVNPECAPRAVELTLALEDLGEVRLLFSATNAAVPAGAGAPPPGAGQVPPC